MAYEALEPKIGIEFDYYEMVKNVYTKVYGKASGSVADEPVKFTGIILTDELGVFGPFSSGTLNETFLLTKSDIPKSGGRISYKTLDGRTRRFSLQVPEGKGYFLEIFSWFKLASLGD